ncbi:MAG: RNA-binding cell elongation regulator Jag/EloR [Clostridia bacterium]
MEKIEIKASSVEKAIAEGLQKLGIDRASADIEVVQEGGLFKQAIVRLSKKLTPADKIIEFLNGLFEKMQLRCYANCEEKENELAIEISGSDSGIVIGYRGEVLDAIQYLALILANQDNDKFVRVSIDAESYREKREQVLEGLAGRLAIKAYKSGKKVELEPMNPFERRIIHTALQNSEYATTESEGDEPMRHVIIIPKVRTNPTERRGDYSSSRNGTPKNNSYGYQKRRY